MISYKTLFILTLSTIENFIISLFLYVQWIMWTVPLRSFVLLTIVNVYSIEIKRIVEGLDIIFKAFALLINELNDFISVVLFACEKQRMPNVHINVVMWFSINLCNFFSFSKFINDDSSLLFNWNNLIFA